MPRRIIGTDHRPMAGALRAQARETQQDAVDILSKGNRYFADLSARMTQDQIDATNATAQAASASAQAAAASAQSKAAGWGELIKAVGMLNETQQREATRRMQAIQQQQNRLNEVETAKASVELDQLLANGDNYIKQTSPTNFENKIHTIIGKYQYLSPENAASLFSRGYGALEDYNNSQFQQREQYIDETHALILDQKKERLGLQVQGILSNIKHSWGDNSDLWNKFDTTVQNFMQNEENKNLDPKSVAQLQLHALNLLSNSTRISSDQQAEVNKRIQAAQSFIDLAAQAQIEYGDNPPLMRVRLNQIAAQTGFPLSEAIAVTDPLQAQRIAQERLQLNQNTRELIRNQIIDKVSEVEVDRATIGYIAANLDDPVFRQQVEDDPIMSEIPMYKKALAVYEQHEQYRDLADSTAREVKSITTQQAQWNSSTNSYIMGGEGSREKVLNTIQSFIALNSHIPEVAENFEQLRNSMPQSDPNNPEFTPQQKQQAMEAWMEWRKLGSQVFKDYSRALQDRLRQAAEPLQPYGIIDFDLRKPETKERLRAQYELKREEMQNLINAMPQGGVPQGATPNFNEGEPVAFFRAENTLGQEMILPFRAGTPNVWISDGYGAAGSPRHGRNRNHGGMDVAAPNGTPVISPVNGVVVAINTNPNNPTKLGKFVDIKDNATGRIHRFAHGSRISVKMGDKVSRGQEFFYVGNTGRSTGAHLHWELRTQTAGRFENTLDIEAHGNDFNQPQAVRKPRGDNEEWYQNASNPYATERDDTSDLELLSIPANALPLSNGHSVQNGMLMKNNQPVKPTSEAFTEANPQKVSYSRYDKTGFDPEIHNNPTNNYGYSQLARNPSHAAKLNEVATRLGIPAVWLADVIAFESGFNPQADNGYDPDGDGFGYIGLIQFGKAAANDLGTTPYRISRMGFNEQMELAYRYLNRPWFRGKLTTVSHVLAAIFGGIGLVNKLNKNPRAAFGIGDKNIKFGAYLKRLGQNVGRQYQIPGLTGRRRRASTPVHERYHANCPTCNAIANSGTNFYPHEGQVA